MKFATIGTSAITESFLHAASQCEGFSLKGVYSRSMEKARAFGQKYHAEKFYDSLESLALDPEIEAVYIASPNFMHCGQVIRMLKAKKHVLCEKSLGSNSEEVEKMFWTARENKVLLLEAMRPLFDPGLSVVRDNLPKLGKIRMADFHYGKYSSKYDRFKAGEHQNIFDKNCSAGALMDMGVYCVHPMVWLFGFPLTVDAQAVMLPGEIDGAGAILAKYNEMVAQLSYTKITNSILPSVIQGENGIMEITDLSAPKKIRILYNNGTEENLPVTPCENNMVYEIRRFIQAVESKDTMEENKVVSIIAMKIMDEARRQNEIQFPADSPE